MKKTKLTLMAAILLSIVAIPSYLIDVPLVSCENNQYSIQQATSDQAQLNTLAFSGLAFLTGDLCADSFLPPGKVADFFGFQYLRDTTQVGMGHSTDFLTNAANNVLYVLNDNQRAQMVSLAKNQSISVNEYAYMRYPLMVAFRRQLNGTMPTGTALSKDQVMNYSATLFQLDAQITIARAKLFASIINSLNSTQRSYLDNMVKGGFASWPALPNQLGGQHLGNDEQVLVMTYASEMFGWYAGNIESDTYFCPERHADYFGGFYIKDAPAIGNPGYTINETITGESGAAFLAALSVDQRAIITNIVNIQKVALTKIVEDRRAIAIELRNALNSSVLNETRIIALESDYGKCDGEISYYYANAFSQVAKSLNTTQITKLLQIRNLDGYPTEPGKIYLYSQKINQPQIQNTDFLFSAVTTPTPSSKPSTPTNTPNIVATITPSPSANHPNQLMTATPTPIPSDTSNEPKSTVAPTAQPTVPEFQTYMLILLLLAVASLLPVFKSRIGRGGRCFADV